MRASRMRAVCGLGLLLLAVGQASAQQGDRDDLTVVTAHRLVFDYSKQYALFERDVVVIDPNLNLMADSLIIKFDDNSDVQSIVAKGHVVIEQQDMRAESGVAAYDVASGKIVLEDKPLVRRGKDMLTGEVITFWRDENRMICEPHARLIIFPSQDGPRSRLIGD